MKKYFIRGLIAAPLVLSAVWVGQYIMRPSLSITEEEKQDILDEVNYTAQYADKLLPMFEVSLLSKGAVSKTSLGAFKGKPTIVHVWATWCTFCEKELPDFSAFSKKYSKKYNILPVNVDIEDTQEAAIKKASDAWRKGGYYDMPMVIDHQAQFTRALTVQGLPSTIFIDKEGKEIGRINGLLEWNDPKLIEVIEGLLG